MRFLTERFLIGLCEEFYLEMEKFLPRMETEVFWESLVKPFFLHGKKLSRMEWKGEEE